MEVSNIIRITPYFSTSSVQNCCCPLWSGFGCWWSCHVAEVTSCIISCLAAISTPLLYFTFLEGGSHSVFCTEGIELPKDPYFLSPTLDADEIFWILSAIFPNVPLRFMHIEGPFRSFLILLHSSIFFPLPFFLSFLSKNVKFIRPSPSVYKQAFPSIRPTKIAT
jgi:hypothetical protein